MRYIKKVSVAPIPPTEGAVVDSLQGESTVNAPSIRAVNDALANLGSQGWTEVAKNTNHFSYGTIKYIQFGKFVVVDFQDIIVNSEIPHGSILASGLPKPATHDHMFMINGTNGSTTFSFRMNLNANGIIVDWYDEKTANASLYYYGQFIYLTNN